MRVERSGVHAALIAGGNGSRLRPFTDVLPKLLVPVEGHPVLDYALDALQRAGVATVHLMLGRHADLIQAYVFSQQHRWPTLRIEAVVESRALGTAGPLRLLDGVGAHLLVLNGDVVTGADLGAVIEDHLSAGADLTVVGAPYEVNVPFGVMYADEDNWLQKFDEKPAIKFTVGAGVYVIGQRARAILPAAGPESMSELIERVLAHRLRVRQHRLVPGMLWCEVGEPLGYLAAQQSVRVAVAGANGCLPARQAPQWRHECESLNTCPMDDHSPVCHTFSSTACAPPRPSSN